MDKSCIYTYILIYLYDLLKVFTNLHSLFEHTWNEEQPGDPNIIAKVAIVEIILTFCSWTNY